MSSSSRKKPSSTSSLKASALKALKAVDRRLSKSGLAQTKRRQSGSRSRNTGARGARPVRNPSFARNAPEELIAPAPLPRHAANGVEWLPVPGWDFPWLWAGFSTRKGGLSRAYSIDGAPGELNLGITASDDRETVLRNRRLFAEAITSKASTPLISLRQFHSNRTVYTAGADAALKQPHKGDGQITDEPGLLLAIQTADCIPVLIADRKRRAVAAFHAGWRGTLKRIVESGVGQMRLAFGSHPEDLIAAIGPGIGLCCYAVGEEVLSEFDSQFSYSRDLFREVYDTDPVRRKYPMLFLTQRAPGHSSIGPSLHVDLIEANRRQLLSAGLAPESIQIVGGCTQCHPDLFFSHRGSHGHAGRMMAAIGIREARKHRPS
jgi:polyphenol oxidase